MKTPSSRRLLTIAAILTLGFFGLGFAMLVGVEGTVDSLVSLASVAALGIVATYVHEGETRDYTPVAAATAGDVVQLPDGRAAVVINDIAAGDLGAANSCGIFDIAKTTGIVILDGGRVYYDHSAGKAHFKKVNDRDFYLGVAVGDAASAATTVRVALNTEPAYVVDVARDPIDSVIVKTAGTPQLRALGGAMSLEFSATAEAQKVDVLSKDGFAVSSNPIVEFALEVVNGGDDAAFDFNCGVANATHASDADSITESCFIHLDGNSANIAAESDDGTTEVAATDTAVDYVAGTRFEVWMDLRDPSDVQIYIDGVLVLSGTTFDVSAATGPLKLLAHLEKSSNDTAGEVHVDWLRARIAS